MDVLMPDGTTITGVPEGTTQTELLARYGKYTAAKTAAPEQNLPSVAKPVTAPPRPAGPAVPTDIMGNVIGDGVEPAGIASLAPAAPVLTAPPKPPSEFAPGEELVKGAAGAFNVALPSMWEQAGVMKDVGVLGTVQKRLELFGKIDQGEVKDFDELRGLDLTTSQARSYLGATPEQRDMMKARLAKEVGQRTEFVKASINTLAQYQEEMKKYKGRTTDLTDVEGAKDFANWLGYNVGSGAVQLAPIMIAAVTTGGPGVLALGTTMGVSEAVGNRMQFLESKIKDLPDDKKAEAVIDYVTKTGDTSLAVGIISGALDNLLGPAATLAKRGLSQVVKGETRAKALKEGIKEIPKQAGEEFITGGAQEAAQIAGAVREKEQSEFLTVENLKKILNSAAAEAAGAVGGGGMSTAARVYGAKPEEKGITELLKETIEKQKGKPEVKAQAAPIEPTAPIEPPAGPAAPSAELVAQTIPTSESQNYEDMLAELEQQIEGKPAVAAAKPVEEPAPKEPEVSQVTPESKTEDVLQTAETPTLEEPVTSAAPEAVGRATELTKEQYRADQETFGKSAHGAMGIDLGSVKNDKQLINKYGENDVRTLGKLYGITVKDIKSVAKKLLDINENLKTVEGKTAEDYTSINVAGLKDLLKQMGLSTFGNRQALVDRLVAYQPSITKAFGERLQDAKHKTAVTKAVQNNQPVSDEVLKDYPDLMMYARDRNSEAYKLAARRMALKITQDSRGTEIPAVAQSMREDIKNVTDPKQLEIMSDIADAIDEYYETTFGERSANARAPVVEEKREPIPRQKNTLTDFFSTGEEGELELYNQLSTQPQHKDILAAASNALQQITHQANDLGFEIYRINSSSPEEAKALRNAVTDVTVNATMYAATAKKIEKNPTPENKKRLEKIKADLEQAIKDAGVSVKPVAPVAPAVAAAPIAPVTSAEKKKSTATKTELEKATTEAYKKFDKAVKEYNKIYENYQKNKTDENLRKLYEASIRYNELNIAYDEVSLNQAQYEHSIGYLDDSQLETFTENNKNNTNSAKKNIATTNKELEELSKKPNVEKAKPKTALEKASPLRIAAYKKNPFLTLLAEKGLYHEKGKPGSQMNEFNAGQQILVSGYGPIFKRSGMLPDDLVVYAIQDGYLPQDATESDVVRLIELAISGKKVEPIYSEQGQEDMAAKYAERAAEEEDSYEERTDQTDAEWYGMSEDKYTELMADRLTDVSDEDFSALDGAINELMDTPSSTMTARAAMEALGFTEEEIQNEERKATTKAGETAAKEEAPSTTQGEAAPELELQQQTAQELKAKQDEIDRLNKENERLAKQAEAKAKADAERGDFVLTGSNRPADEAAARGQQDIFGAAAEPVAEEAAPKEELFYGTPVEILAKRMSFSKDDVNSGMFSIADGKPIPKVFLTRASTQEFNKTIDEAYNEKLTAFEEDLEKQRAGEVQAAMNNLKEYSYNPVWVTKILKKLRSVGGAQARLAGTMMDGLQRMWENGEFANAAQRVQHFAKSAENRKRLSMVYTDESIYKEMRGAFPDKRVIGPERGKALLAEFQRLDKEATKIAKEKKKEAAKPEMTEKEILARMKELTREEMKDPEENPARDKEQADLARQLKALKGAKVEEAAKEEPAAEPNYAVTTPDNKTLRYPLAYGLVNSGYDVLALDDPRTYVDKGENPHRTFEKDGVRIALTPQQSLFELKGKVSTGIGNPEEVTFEALLVDPSKRRQGKANQALTDLTQMADEYGVTLYLEPAPLVNIKEKNFGLDIDQLADLYKKFGFEFQDELVMARKPEVEVLPKAERPAAGRLPNEPYTFEGEFTEKGEEEQVKLLETPIEKLNKDQISTLEKHYGLESDTAEFVAAVRKDVLDFVVKGATAVNGKIRAIIRALVNGVLATSLIFNPQFVSNAYTVSVPQYDVSQRQVLEQIPNKVAGQMSEAAKRAYAVIYPALKAQLKANNKFFIVADKQTATTFIFNPDGTPFMYDKTLFGAGIGDFMKGDNNVVANRITPAGLFDLGMRDAQRSADEAYMYGDYDFGKVFVLDKAYMGKNGPYSQLVMHSVWLHESDAKQRLAALDKPGADDSRYSFGCINVKKDLFRDLVTNHVSQMDGAKIFIVPENGSNVMDFVNGKATYSPDIIRQRVAPVTEEVKTEKQRAEQRTGAKVYAREEEGPTFFNLERKLPPGRSPELAAAAQMVKEGTMTAEEYGELVDLYKPIRPYAEALKPATKEQVYDALDSAKRERINPDIPDGTKVGLRLDIPAFNRKGVYVVSIHQKGTKSGPGKVLGYDSVARVTNVTFGLGRETEALKIAAGAGKDAIQTIEGSYEKISPADAYAQAKEALNDPAWTQIGIDPTRHSYFYDRSTTQPVIAAEQVIQIGNMILGKNVTFGNKGDFLYELLPEDYSGQKPSDWDYIPDVQEEVKRSPSLKRRLDKLNRDREAGKITDEKFIAEVDAALEQAENARYDKMPKGRVRGYRRIKEVLNRAVRNGDISAEGADMAEWFMDQNRDLVEQLGISVRAPKEGGVGGFYNQLSRVMTLIKGGQGRETIVHEILHHLERMMPADIQKAIREAWGKQLLAAQKKAKTPAEKLYFAALLNAHYGNDDIDFLDVPNGDMSVVFAKALSYIAYESPGNKSSLKLAQVLLKMGDVSYEMYQYYNPSEFWAVNGTRIVEGRYDAVKGGVLAKLKNWLRELGQKIKSVFGFDSDAPILRALNSLSKADGNFVSAEMLTQGFKHDNIRRNVAGDPAPASTWDSPDESKMKTVEYKLVDKQVDLKDVIKSIKQTVGDIADKWNAYIKEELYHGRTAKAVQDFLNKELLPIVEELKDNNITLAEFDVYLHNRHAEERNEQISRVNPKYSNTSEETSGSGISSEAAAKYLAGLSDDRRAAFESMAAKVDAMISKTQRILVDGGLEKQEVIDAWNQAYEHYVPLQRDDLDFVHHGSGLGSGYGTKGGSSKRAAGSLKKVVDIFANIALQRERAITRSEKARVGRALYGLAIQNPNPNFWLPVNPDAVKNPEKLAEELINLGLKPEDAANVLQEPKVASFNKKTGLVQYQVNPVMRNSDNVFPIRINGEDRFIFFNPSDPRALRMVESLKNLDAEQLDVFLGTVGAVTRWIASVNTQYNPVFGAWNFARDVSGAAFNLTTTPIADRKAEVMSGVFPALRGIYSELRAGRNKSTLDTEWAQLFEQFQKAGGQTGYKEQFSKGRDKANIVERELEKLDRGNVRKAAAAVFNWLSDYNDAMENAVRLSAFKVALDAGLTEERAASIAKNLTVNFNRKGASSPILQALYAFFNAAVQGTMRVGQTLTGPSGKKIMAGGFAVGVFQALALAMAGYDDDEPPEYLKNKNLILPVPGGNYLIIPMPLGFNIFPGMGRLTTEYVLGQAGLISSTKSAGSKVISTASLIIDAFNPLGSGSLIQVLAPTVVDPIAAIQTNRDAFGRPISKEDRATNPTPGYTRSRETASAFSQGLAEFLNYVSSPMGTKYTKGAISPTADQIDYLIGQYTGGVGREFIKTTEYVRSKFTGEEVPSYRVPIVGKLYGETESPAAISAKFYDNVTRMAEHENEIKSLIKNKEKTADYKTENPEWRFYNRANYLENQITQINQQKKLLRERDAPEERIKKLDERKTALMKKFNDQVKAAQ